MRSRYKKGANIADTVQFYGDDILYSNGFKSSGKNMQHGDISVMDHSISVTCLSVRLAKLTHLKFDYQALVRGALLHDYFLYDWHEPGNRLHGYRHADKALQNAAEDFSLTPTEAYMISRHMFPLNLRPPRSREGVILCIADKVCAVKETVSKPFYSKTVKKIRDAK